VLRGGDGRDVLRGGPDDDTGLGQEGDDLMAGGPGDDAQDGGAGNDRIFANLGRDTTEGGPGNDVLWALIRFDVTGPGDVEGDVVRGGDGDDRIRTRDGEQDVVNCGAGDDVAILDLADVIEGASPTAPDGDCERVRRAEPRAGDDAEERQQSAD
jgi:Ca2+-binding RTX toxin-like protein